MPKRIRYPLLLLSAILLTALAWYARPQSLNALIPQTGVMACHLLLSPADGPPRMVELDPKGPQYQSLIDLLHSTGYRRLVSDLLPLGHDSDSPERTLAQTVSIHVRTGMGNLSLTFYGDQITYTRANGDSIQLIPLSGRPLQQKVLALATQLKSFK